MYVSVSGGEWIQMSNDDTSQAVMMVVALVTKKFGIFCADYGR